MTSTALVPVEAYDAQVIRLIKKIDTEQKTVLTESQTNKQIRAIKATIKGICLEGAISILNAFGYANDEFHYKGIYWKIHDLLNEKHFPDYQGFLAQDTPVFWFWGGPPSKLKWYKGTLQTLLEDRLLCEICNRGTDEVARWVGLDLDRVGC